ncbi:head-tail connector protein [Proteus faecis]|uniref:Head-tail connector protein n=1 Tax=Proteus faecis TaxID=2050967 RepID=A0AAW7CMU3_9GAMM|nr:MULTISPECIES: head-tail connector protein [Enterobacterales]MDL5167971.1 head-tail connector protein [Proteus faecis]MDL5191218.1 head-tail connector protein [Escherichia coli]MDL5275956.1 head-tail connector protein [Proteus faecis]MDL5279523.1 head-tail connector protein [Proteus faecis]MDL5308665.1 head-tail connector protein [Proteus faecis]
MNILDVIPLSLLKQHLEYSGDDRDEQILFYAQSALNYCLRWCDEPTWKSPDDIPYEVKSAMLLVLGDMFEHRTSQSEILLYENKAVERLLLLCRNWRGS